MSGREIRSAFLGGAPVAKACCMVIWQSFSVIFPFTQNNLKNSLHFLFKWYIIIWRQVRPLYFWRCRLVGRGRATGNRVGAKSVSRVRISPSPPPICQAHAKKFFMNFLAWALTLVFSKSSKPCRCYKNRLSSTQSPPCYHRLRKRDKPVSFQLALLQVGMLIFCLSKHQP